MTREEALQLYREKQLPHFVDLMMLADDAMAEYRMRKGEEGPGFEEMDFRERLLFAHAMVAMGVNDRVNKIAAPPPPAAAPPPSAPADVPLVPDAEPQLPVIAVRVDPVKAQEAFALMIAKRRIAVPAAQAVLDALQNTPEGNDMLKLLLYNSVVRQRQNTGGGS